MNKKVKRSLTTLLIAVVAFWGIAQVPFSEKIDQKINATVYQNGTAIEQTTVVIRGEKTRYLLKENSFVGEFRIPYVEKTDIDDLQTQIKWNNEDRLQSIHHFYKGNFSTSDQRGLAYYLLISEDMDEFALMTTNQEIIATSDELCKLYANRISYNGDGKMSVFRVEEIPELR
ncbi:MAG: hypothetical protein IIV78_04315 [Oscillospiraceae bacterium]|nr:hypothetical protein [Oscillospiraceae bacterium]